MFGHFLKQQKKNNGKSRKIENRKMGEIDVWAQPNRAPAGARLLGAHMIAALCSL
jgi:hypothetical protein